jgi:hypothetical protein
MFSKSIARALSICFFVLCLAGCGGGGSDDVGGGGGSGGGSGGGGGGGGGVALGAITLAWDANTQPQVAGYKLYYGTASNAYSDSADVGNPTPSAGTVTYTLSGLTEGQTYFIAATVYDASRLESALSAEVSGVAR